MKNPRAAARNYCTDISGRFEWRFRDIAVMVSGFGAWKNEVLSHKLTVLS